MGLRWLVIGLAVFLGGWFAFEGGRALVVGDYITPKSGRYAGQLGPWHHLVKAVGIEPRSTLMKAIFLGYGLVWLVVAVGFAAGTARPWWWGMLILAVGALWYLPFGTLIALVQIVLLIVIRRSGR